MYQFVTFYRRMNPDSPPASPMLLLGIFLFVLTLIIIAVWICKDDN
jgi:hypothetical protein